MSTPTRLPSNLVAPNLVTLPVTTVPIKLPSWSGADLQDVYRYVQQTLLVFQSIAHAEKTPTRTLSFTMIPQGKFVQCMANDPIGDNQDFNAINVCGPKNTIILVAPHDLMDDAKHQTGSGVFGELLSAYAEAVNNLGVANYYDTEGYTAGVIMAVLFAQHLVTSTDVVKVLQDNNPWGYAAYISAFTLVWARIVSRTDRFARTYLSLLMIPFITSECKCTG
jgi:hypothetical protein